jgi:hypothetical protein
VLGEMINRSAVSGSRSVGAGVPFASPLDEIEKFVRDLAPERIGAAT